MSKEGMVILFHLERVSMGKMCELIQYKQETYAILVRDTYKNKDVDFFTDVENTLQMGMVTREAGYLVEPHIHTCDPFQIYSVQEYVFVKRGDVQMSFYTDNGKKYKTVTLHNGDSVLTMRGGHGLRFINRATILEVKHGPYDKNIQVFF